MKALPAALRRGPRALRAPGRRAVFSPLPVGRRHLQAPRAGVDGSISNATPLPAASVSSGLSPTPDASFHVLGSPFSLLGINLSPSQTLYTRRGTLVALTGKAENALSTLSLQSPIRGGLLGVPFMYQKISSTSPITAVVGTNSISSSFATIHLDGRLDWIVAQRTSLLAWTGQALSVKPKMNFRMNPAYWGNTFITGRGLAAVVGTGQIYQINLLSGEDYVIHPKHVVAYTLNGTAPTPFRFKSSTFTLQLPSLSSILPDTRFFREMRSTTAWKWTASALYTVRTWTRRSIWGDRLFLNFQGPMTILVQSRGSRITDSLRSDTLNDTADAPAGQVQALASASSQSAEPQKATIHRPVASVAPAPKLRYATISPSGKVDIK